MCWGPGWICLALSGAFALFVLAPTRYKTATAAAALRARWPNLPPQPADLSEEQWRANYGNFFADLMFGYIEKYPGIALVQRLQDSFVFKVQCP